jgi:hypothetical protein
MNLSPELKATTTVSLPVDELTSKTADLVVRAFSELLAKHREETGTQITALKDELSQKIAASAATQAYQTVRLNEGQVEEIAAAVAARVMSELSRQKTEHEQPPPKNPMTSAPNGKWPGLNAMAGLVASVSLLFVGYWAYTLLFV